MLQLAIFSYFLCTYNRVLQCFLTYFRKSKYIRVLGSIFPDYFFSCDYSILYKKHDILTNNPPVKIYFKKIENRITFETKTEYYLKLLTCDTMKLLGSFENKITKEKMMKKDPFRNY